MVKTNRSLTRPTNPPSAKQMTLSTAGRATLLLGIACLAIIVFQSITNEEYSGRLVFAVASGAVAGLVLLDSWVMRNYGEKPPTTVALLVLVSHASLVELVSLVDGFTYTSVLYLTLPFPAFFMLERRAGYGISIALLVWLTIKFFILKPNWLSDPVTVNSVTLLYVAIALIMTIAEVAQRERASRQHAEKLLADLNTSHRQLAEYADQVAELATIEERNRLARDIHDSLGHYLTVIGIQLEKVRAIYRDDPEETLTSIQNAKRMTDQALSDVRESVNTLRARRPAFALRPALMALSENLEHAPYRIVLEIAGSETDYSQHQLMVLYRAVQEGLTNVQKHAAAKNVAINVSLGRDEAMLTLRDDGVGIANPLWENQGVGLVGLRERIELVSGRLQIESSPTEGTTLHVRIPRREGNK